MPLALLVADSPLHVTVAPEMIVPFETVVTFPVTVPVVAVVATATGVRLKFVVVTIPPLTERFCVTL